MESSFFSQDLLKDFYIRSIDINPSYMSGKCKNAMLNLCILIDM